MRDLISIGRFAQITQLTIKALHIYAEMGLLCPVVIDRQSGYRYYSITQLPLARRIRLLRAVNMPLAAIQAVLHADTPTAVNAHLQEHQQRLVAHIAKEQQALQLLQQIMAHQTDDLAFTVQVKQAPAQLIASIHVHTTPAEENRLIPLLVDELYAYTTALAVRDPASPSVRISHEYTEELVASEIAVPITQSITPTGRITTRLLESSLVAYVIHVGPHADLWAVYWAVLSWIPQQGYEKNGPPREVYWMHPSAGQSTGYRTEVQWPVRPGALPPTTATGASHARR